MSTLCQGTTKAGNPCGNKTKDGKYCHLHVPGASSASSKKAEKPEAVTCCGKTKDGEPCGNKTKEGKYCHLHVPGASSASSSKKPEKPEAVTCCGKTKDGEPCGNKTKEGKYCHLHVHVPGAAMMDIRHGFHVSTHDHLYLVVPLTSVVSDA